MAGLFLMFIMAIALGEMLRGFLSAPRSNADAVDRRAGCALLTGDLPQCVGLWA